MSFMIYKVYKKYYLNIITVSFFQTILKRKIPGKFKQKKKLYFLMSVSQKLDNDLLLNLLKNGTITSHKHVVKSWLGNFRK